MLLTQGQEQNTKEQRTEVIEGILEWLQQRLRKREQRNGEPTAKATPPTKEHRPETGRKAEEKRQEERERDRTPTRKEPSRKGICWAYVILKGLEATNPDGKSDEWTLRKITEAGLSDQPDDSQSTARDPKGTLRIMGRRDPTIQAYTRHGRPSTRRGTTDGKTSMETFELDSDSNVS